jgi:hypothetical protein
VSSVTPVSSAQTEFRTPLGPRLFSLVGVLLLAAVTVFQLLVGFFLLLKGQWLVALVVLACACLMAALTDYVGRDLRGKWGLRVALEPDALRLELPSGRGAPPSLASWRSASSSLPSCCES